MVNKFDELGFTKMVVEDSNTWPVDEQEVIYVFNRFSDNPSDWSAFNGKFYLDKTRDEHDHGTFASIAGFCDWYDVPYWKPR